LGKACGSKEAPKKAQNPITDFNIFWVVKLSGPKLIFS
jgi:hypothetical protein